MSPNFWLATIFSLSLLLAISSYMLKKAEQKLAQLQYDKIMSGLTEVHKILATTDRTVSQEWIKIDFVNETGGTVDCAGVDFIFLLFKASSGIINGIIKIEGTELIYPFSTRANSNFALCIKNQFIPEKGHYIRFPNFEYQITEKIDRWSELSIILFAVLEAGDARVLKLERPIVIK